MKKVQILGTGCPKCKKLAEAATKAVAQAGVEAEVVKVDDMNEIFAFGVMMTPALAVDGTVKTAGTLPSVDEIKKLIA